MPQILAIWSLSDGVVFLFLVALLALPVTDRWLRWSEKIARYTRLAKEDDVFFGVFVAGLFAIGSLEAGFGYLARFTAIVHYLRVEHQILRINVVGMVGGIILLGVVVGPLLCAWLARSSDRSPFKWAFYGMVMNWAGVVWLVLNGNRTPRQ